MNNHGTELITEQKKKTRTRNHWARIFNLKEAAKTLIFLKENGIDSYDDLVKKSSSASGGFAALSKKIKEAESRMSEISELQKHIGTCRICRNFSSQKVTPTAYSASSRKCKTATLRTKNRLIYQSQQTRGAWLNEQANLPVRGF